MNQDDHSRVIIHIDLDCFYAQVETIKNPSLETVPLGIQQKSIVVTSNYIAREYGVTKCMPIREAEILCPNLVLVKGEDLHDYRQTSYKVTAFLQKYSKSVERLGLDENYLDVTTLVDDRLRLKSEFKTVGHVIGDTAERCDCGCYERLQTASELAQDIRDALKNELKLTSCAGIAHNKLLAKLAGATHKPNQQTVVFPNGSQELLLRMKLVGQIPGIGKSIAETLSKLQIITIEDLQNVELEKLKTSFPPDKATHLRNLSFGIDTSIVKPTGKPQSIGLEDSCRSITVEIEVKDKIEQLLKRLMILVNEDGRTPRTIKLVIRKFDNVNKVSHREQKQCNVNQTLFNVGNGSEIMLSETSEKKLLGVIMNLFNRMVDVKRPYHITLLGLSFTKFQDRAAGKSSITSFLKKNVEVQTITSIENKKDLSGSLTDYHSNQSDFNTDGSESEIEPSPKKKKFTTLIARRRCFTKDCPSPSKLNVAELRINAKEDEVSCPPKVDKDVFVELPKDMQKELWEDYLRERDRTDDNRNIKKPKLNTLLNYFVKY